MVGGAEAVVEVLSVAVQVVREPHRRRPRHALPQLVLQLPQQLRYRRCRQPCRATTARGLDHPPAAAAVQAQ